MKTDTITKTAPPAPLNFAAWVGLDWGHEEHAFALADRSSQTEEGKLTQTAETLHAWLQQLAQRFLGQPVALAIEASRANAALNGVDAWFDVPDALAPGTFDIVVANILANPLQLLSPLLAGRVARGGSIVLSGILEGQALALVRGDGQIALYLDSPLEVDRAQIDCPGLEVIHAPDLTAVVDGALDRFRNQRIGAAPHRLIPRRIAARSQDLKLSDQTFNFDNLSFHLRERGLRRFADPHLLSDQPL